jgi:cation-transporting ATPase E
MAKPSKNENIERYKPDPRQGLADAQVKERIKARLNNISATISTKTIPKILSDNIFTLFNIINFILALFVVLVGSYKNALFIGVVAFNLIIGIIQEIRAKKAVDNLSLISSVKVKVLRESREQKLNMDEIVLDDILILESGNQVPTDCAIYEGECEVNESLLTGESDSISKKSGDSLLSGSYLVSGSCRVRADKVGKSNYIYKISQSAKYIKKLNSEIMKTFNKIILISSVLIIPIGGFLFLNQMNLKDNNLTSAVVNTVAALLGIMPQGLILLTSTVLAVSVIKLSKQKVLTNELYSIETLARADVLCLDKTGTITEGTMEIGDIIPYNGATQKEIDEALCFLTSSLYDNSPTFMAIKSKYFKHINKTADKIIPFSSQRKWSAVHFSDKGSFIFGAPEFILNDDSMNCCIDKHELLKIQKNLEKYSKNNRVLLLAHSEHELKNNCLPDKIKIMAFILLNDKIRKDAKETLEFFSKQGVDIKIISGDNITTVANIARSVGLKNAEKSVDMSKIHSEQEVKNAAIKYSIFGRVSPFQKKQIICSLKENGFTVAMTGDGVNDVLALKESDCSIALASGSSAARNVSQFVLLKSNFSALPKVVAEGRQTINNIQRSSSLFLVRTIYSILLAIIFLFIKIPYPFTPIQMTLTNALTIGIPSFILALEPNKERFKGNFFLNIIGNATPCALTIVTNIFLLNFFACYLNIDKNEASTLSVILLAFTGFMLLYKICYPFNLLRRILLWSMVFCFVATLIFPIKYIFSLISLGLSEILVLLVLIAISFFSFYANHKIVEYIINLAKRKSR